MDGWVGGWCVSRSRAQQQAQTTGGGQCGKRSGTLPGSLCTASLSLKARHYCSQKTGLHICRAQSTYNTQGCERTSGCYGSHRRTVQVRKTNYIFMHMNNNSELHRPWQQLPTGAKQEIYTVTSVKGKKGVVMPSTVIGTRLTTFNTSTSYTHPFVQ